jgi:uncharacterized cupin superfamily protein
MPGWTEGAGGPHPLTGQDNGPYAEIALGDLAALTQFGARLERLPPGSASSHRHWHETEDEFVYVLSGAVVLVEDTETPLGAGQAAAWPAGAPEGHCLVNRGSTDAVLLVVGHRAARGVVHYPDHDLVLHHGLEGRRFTRADGTPVPDPRAGTPATD